MKKILQGILTVFLFIWQLPQCLVASVMILVLSDSIEKIEKKKFYCYLVTLKDNTFLYGVSLGLFVFLRKDYPRFERTFNHERGHCIQSLMSAWLYLIIFGLPSYINYSRAKVDGEFRKNYEKKFPENFANFLGGIKD